MDYSKSGNAKSKKGTPKHDEHNAKGSNENPFGNGANDKAALLARMKAAAAAKKE